jgi:hypothetical protein
MQMEQKKMSMILLVSESVLIEIITISVSR